MPQQGFFITFEGGEGCGKTTQIQLLNERLQSDILGHSPVITREPGGVPAAELIRGLLVTGDTDKWRPVTEAFLVSAARHEHVEQVIRPALAQSKIVLCDRFIDSTLVYQGIVGGVDAGVIRHMNQIACGDIYPDLTIILDMESRVGLARAQSRGAGEDRFESKGLAFHQQVRAGFIEMAQANKDRCVLIDADRAPDEIADNIFEIVIQRLKGRRVNG